MRVVIRPSGSHPDILTIRDATDQVRDIFELAEIDESSVAWKLVFATTNTPLTVAAEIVAMAPDLSPAALDAFARSASGQLREGFSAVAEGRIAPAWVTGPKAETLKRLLTRSLNGIGRTDVQIDDEEEPEIVTPTIAKAALRELSRLQVTPEEAIDRARTEIGSIDGDYLDLGHHYAHPAVRIRERKSSREIWCWISETDLEKFSDRIKATDIWQHRRVRARGKIIFNSDGDILHVEAADIELIQIARISVNEIRDREFTGGLSVSEYLERFREGTLG